MRKQLATDLCKRLHHAEWTASYPRPTACPKCFALAEHLTRRGWKKDR